MIFIVPILIFSLYIFIYNPGILTYESLAQIHQIASGKFTNSFPFFHTFIEMVLLNIFGTPLSIAVLQMIVFSTIWPVICKYHRDDASESSNKFFAQFIVTLIICLIPINAVYSVTLWPQILFSYSFKLFNKSTYWQRRWNELKVCSYSIIDNSNHITVKHNRHLYRNNNTCCDFRISIYEK